MKILISILLISSVGLFTNNASSPKVYQDISKCSCSGFFGNCAITCSEKNSSCDCILTANCACEGGLYQVLPTQTATQYENSVIAQQYFEDLEMKTGNFIANHLKALRTAIKKDDLETYKKQAISIEQIFNELNETEKTAFMTWAMKTLTVVED